MMLDHVFQPVSLRLAARRTGCGRPAAATPDTLPAFDTAALHRLSIHRTLRVIPASDYDRLSTFLMGLS
jgi:hypothetical protein